MTDTPEGSKVAADLRDAILDGTYLPGARLPDVASLMSDYNEWCGGVSGAMIREALGQLREEGLAVSSPPEMGVRDPDVFVADPLPDHVRLQQAETDLRQVQGDGD